MIFIKKTRIEYQEIEDKIITCNLETGEMDSVDKEYIEDKEKEENSETVFNSEYYKLANGFLSMDAYCSMNQGSLSVTYELKEHQYVRFMLTITGSIVLCTIFSGTKQIVSDILAQSKVVDPENTVIAVAS